MSPCRDNPGSQLEDDVDLDNGSNLIGNSSPMYKNVPFLRLSADEGLRDDGDNGDDKSNLS